MYTSEGNIIQLIRNCLLGVLSSEDRHKLDVWLEEERENQLLFEKIKKELSLGSEVAVFNKLNDEEAWLQFKELRKRKSKLRIIRRMVCCRNNAFDFGCFMVLGCKFSRRERIGFWHGERDSAGCFQGNFGRG